MILFFKGYYQLQRAVAFHSYCTKQEAADFMFRTAPEMHRFLQDVLDKKVVFQEKYVSRLSDKECSNCVSATTMSISSPFMIDRL